jgi:hypothetical protein
MERKRSCDLIKKNILTKIRIKEFIWFLYTFLSEMSMAALPLQLWQWRRGSGRFFKKSSRCVAAAADLFFEDIEKVHEFDRISVLTSKTPSD